MRGEEQGEKGQTWDHKQQEQVIAMDEGFSSDSHHAHAHPNPQEYGEDADSHLREVG